VGNDPNPNTHPEATLRGGSGGDRMGLAHDSSPGTSGGSSHGGSSSGSKRGEVLCASSDDGDNDSDDGGHTCGGSDGDDGGKFSFDLAGGDWPLVRREGEGLGRGEGHWKGGGYKQAEGKEIGKSGKGPAGGVMAGAVTEEETLEDREGNNETHHHACSGGDPCPNPSPN
ncbi:unnamed protein product, partial [Discosporangium mesarthrocarpum]